MTKENLQIKVQRAVARTLLGLPEEVVEKVAGKATVVAGRTLDPKVQLMLKLQTATKAKKWYEVPLPVARRHRPGNQFAGTGRFDPGAGL